MKIKTSNNPSARTPYIVTSHPAIQLQLLLIFVEKGAAVELYSRDLDVIGDKVGFSHF
jgi:hypothetical protein